MKSLKFLNGVYSPTDTTNNNTSFLMKEENDFVVQALHNKWEEGVLHIFHNLLDTLPKNRLIFDVGAYTGVYTLYAAYHGFTVHSFEPHPNVYERLVYNVTKNSWLNRVSLYNECLSDNDKLVDLQVTGGSLLPSGSSIEPHPTRSLLRTHTVYSRRGDNLILENKIGLIKIDVERHEISVLYGMKKLIQSDKPYIIIELLTVEDFNEVYDFLTLLGYDSCQQLSNISLDAVHTNKETINIGKYTTNFLFLMK